jgi:hypothetical protein
VEGAMFHRDKVLSSVVLRAVVIKRLEVVVKVRRGFSIVKTLVDLRLDPVLTKLSESQWGLEK